MAFVSSAITSEQHKNINSFIIITGFEYDLNNTTENNSWLPALLIRLGLHSYNLKQIVWNNKYE